MTKSNIKAKNNFVKVVIDKEEYWIDPLNIVIGEKTLKEFNEEVANNKKEFEAYKREKTIEHNKLLKELESLRKSNQAIDRKLETYKKNLENIVRGLVER